MSDKNKAPQNPAAEVNAAPQNPAPQGNGQPKNRFFDLFESIHFQTAASGKQYANDDGSVIRKVASGTCLLVGGFCAVNFNVYARKSAQGKVTAEASFVGTRATQAIAPIDERAKAEFAAYKGHLAERYRLWRKDQGKIEAPIKQTAAELDDAEDLFA